MSRKDYIAIAAVLKSQMLLAPYVALVANDLCEIFKTDNPAFNRDRFLAACGIQNSTKKLVGKVS